MWFFVCLSDFAFCMGECLIVQILFCTFGSHGHLRKANKVLWYTEWVSSWQEDWCYLPDGHGWQNPTASLNTEITLKSFARGYCIIK